MSFPTDNLEPMVGVEPKVKTGFKSSNRGPSGFGLIRQSWSVGSASSCSCVSGLAGRGKIARSKSLSEMGVRWGVSAPESYGGGGGGGERHSGQREMAPGPARHSGLTGRSVCRAWGSSGRETPCPGAAPKLRFLSQCKGSEAGRESDLLTLDRWTHSKDSLSPSGS